MGATHCDNCSTKFIVSRIDGGPEAVAIHCPYCGSESVKPVSAAATKEELDAATNRGAEGIAPRRAEGG